MASTKLSPVEQEVTPCDEELELEPGIAATIPFVKACSNPKNSPKGSPKGHKDSPKGIKSSPKTLGKTSSMKNSSPHLKTPLDSRRSAPPRTPAGSSRPGSRRFSGNIELDSLSVYDQIYDAGSRRPSALDILSHTGSEGAAGQRGYSRAGAGS